MAQRSSFDIKVSAILAEENKKRPFAFPFQPYDKEKIRASLHKTLLGSKFPSLSEDGNASPIPRLTHRRNTMPK